MKDMMKNEEKSRFIWIPFYTELAEKLLEYKNNRANLIDFIFSKDGLQNYSKYLHLQDKTKKIDDIDPFSFFGIFNHGIMKNENRITILQKIKIKFQIRADVPSVFYGVPVLNYARSFYYHWSSLKDSCIVLWDAFEAMMKGNLKLWFDYCPIAKRKAECTMPLFWCKANDYIALDSNNVNYLKSKGVDINATDVDAYLDLLQTIKNRMVSGKITEKTFAEISYNAWKNTSENSDSSIIEQNMMLGIVEQYTHILQLKKNIILQGAPGTGKTYNTAALALSICGEAIPEAHEDVMKRYDELQKEGRIGFCTFHQSMDYEDFVEGIKPVNSEEGELYYRVEDGIFKIICTNAEKGNATRTDNFKESWDKLVNYLDENDFLSVDLLSGKGSFNVELNEYGTGLANRTYENGVFEKDKWIQGKSKFFNYEQLYNIYRGLSGTPAGGHDNYRKAIVAKMKKDFSLVDFSEMASASSSQNYVLIIDEINRGNVSKIFGELITLLEADKRIGGDHPIKVTLPYSKESFGVPSNLYIIGTMNTTDRSVGNIDYAVRRRFAFVTLESKEEVIEEHYRNDESLKNKALELFNSVKAFLIKHKFDMDIADLMVGHSYFLAKNEEELGLKWKYEIVPLLHEYYKDGITKQDVKADTSIDDFCNSK